MLEPLNYQYLSPDIKFENKINGKILFRNKEDFYFVIYWAKDWGIFCEPSFADADRVIKYLGQYTHRVALSNQRIQNMTKTSVSFFYKDYRDGE